MAEGSDKRKYHRFLALLDVRVLPGERIPADLRLVTVDIGAGGARCASNRLLGDGTILKMTFMLVGADLRQPVPIEVDARVLRCSEKPRAIESRRYEIALEFVRIDAQDKTRLQGYLNSL